jgi:hypothetical protein
MWRPGLLLVEGRGYICEHGHGRLHAEGRRNEGWACATDLQEGDCAPVVASGSSPRKGGAIHIDSGVLRHAVSLPGRLPASHSRAARARPRL